MKSNTLLNLEHEKKLMNVKTTTDSENYPVIDKNYQKTRSDYIVFRYIFKKNTQ